MSAVHIPRSCSLRMPRSLSRAQICHIYYTPRFAPWRWDYDQLTPNNLMYAKLMDKYQREPRDTLRWHVVANTAAKEAPMAVMRERLRRRVREGFQQALQQGGYDVRGRMSDAGSLTAGETPRRHLEGTLELHCRSRIGLDMDFSELIQHGRDIVAMVVEKRDSSGNQGTRPGRKEWCDVPLEPRTSSGYQV